MPPLVFEKCVVCKQELEGETILHLQHTACSQSFVVHRQCLPVVCCASTHDAVHRLQHGDAIEPKWKVAFKNSKGVTSYAAY